MRIVAAFLLALIAGSAQAERLLIVPLDSRPAAGQYAQMIAKMANVEVRMPPYEMLGRFTRPGDPDGILDWLARQDLTDVSAIVVSSDMIAYGGLIASRVNDVTYERAVGRLQRLANIQIKNPNAKLYVFSSTMRLAPTATKRAAPWRLNLARYMELREKVARTGSHTARAEMKVQAAKVPEAEVRKYEQTRSRDHAVQKELIRMVARKELDYLVVGQDDAKPFGPHVPETQKLRKLVSDLNAGGRVYFCEGIDQHANVLVSRALLRRAGWTPRVRIVYSDEMGKAKYANFESKTVRESLEDQLLASGARPMGGDGQYDYTLYLNTPNPRAARFDRFLSDLKTEIDQGFPVAVADINLGRDGTTDPLLFNGLWENTRIMKLLSFAGWNTAGNTMGTSIPAANVYLLSRRLHVDPLLREVAQREFLLHRFVNDFAYHKFTRPMAYQMIDESRGATREETYGQAMAEVNDFVQRDLTKHLDRYFREQFLGKRFFAGNGQYVFSGLTDVKVWLPWPRAYEVRLEFHLQARPVDVVTGQ
jgi:hypothetical protein